MTSELPARTDDPVVSGESDDDRVPRHALPEQTAHPQPPTSYGELFEYPPYATEDAAMTVELPSEHAPTPVPRPLPAPEAQTSALAPVGAGATATGDPRASSSDQQTVTCPECGATQLIYLNRRDAADFCQRCDFPLFWTPARVTRDWTPEQQGESLRRLPGIAGATRLASAACPHCAELNPVQAQTCIRCGLPMHVVAPPPPEPAPYVPPPPAPAPPPQPQRGLPWWVYTLIATGVVAVILIVLWVAGVLS